MDKSSRKKDSKGELTLFIVNRFLLSPKRYRDDSINTTYFNTVDSYRSANDPLPPVSGRLVLHVTTSSFFFKLTECQ